MPTVDANIWIASYLPTDAFHLSSIEFLREVMSRSAEITCPSIVLVEVACSIARLTRDPSIGIEAAAEIRGNLAVRIVPVDEALLAVAEQIGTDVFLREADALYAATAQLTGSTLVTWDRELIQRAGAVTPTDWLDASG